MGTDIHPYVEIKSTKGWQRAFVSIPRYRSYVSFAILANVRNGFGFAGVPTHETLIPISAPRGLPTDTSIKNDDSNDDFKIWLGDHNFSWVTLAELKAYNLDQPLLRQGVVSGAERAKVEAGGVPSAWCGAKSPMTKEDEHMQWSEPLRDAAGLVVEWIARLEQYKSDRYLDHRADIDNCIRVVFGFDS
jgi:hypothetical protein